MRVKCYIDKQMEGLGSRVSVMTISLSNVIFDFIMLTVVADA